MALSAPRNTPRRANRLISLPVAAATTIFGGAMVSVLATGTGAVPAGTASSGPCVGCANETVDNSAGAAGDLRVTVERACFRYGNSADADAIGIEDIGQPCYIVDDETVALTDDSGAREVAGAIVDVDAVGVWVDVGPGAVGPQGPQGEPA
jgi:hypothetical protein